MSQRRAEAANTKKGHIKAGNAEKERLKSISRSNQRESVHQEQAGQEVVLTVPAAQHEAWYQLLRAHGKVTQCIESRLLRAHQIPHAWYDVLVTLEKAPDQRLRMSELAENVAMTRSTLTRLVDRLEAEGLIRREPCPDDRRGFYAVLTEAGATARLAAWPIVARAIVELFASHISDEEALVTAEALRRVANASAE